MQTRHVDPLPIALDAALARLGGAVELYIRIARGFRQEQSAVVSQLRLLLANGQHADAHRLVHTLKGVADTLGATTLAAFAREVEHPFKQHAAGAPFPAALPLDELDELDELVGRTASALEALAAALRESECSGMENRLPENDK